MNSVGDLHSNDADSVRLAEAVTEGRSKGRRRRNRRRKARHAAVELVEVSKAKGRKRPTKATRRQQKSSARYKARARTGATVDGEGHRHYPKGHPKAGKFVPKGVTNSQIDAEVRRADTERYRQRRTKLRQDMAARGAMYGVMTGADKLTGKRVLGGHVGGHTKGKRTGYRDTRWAPKGPHSQIRVDLYSRATGRGGRTVSRRTRSSTPYGQVIWASPKVGGVIADESGFWVVPSARVSERAARTTATIGGRRVPVGQMAGFRTQEQIKQSRANRKKKKGWLEDVEELRGRARVRKHGGHTDQSVHGRRPRTKLPKRLSRKISGYKPGGRGGNVLLARDPMGRYTRGPDAQAMRQRRRRHAYAVAVLGAGLGGGLTYAHSRKRPSEPTIIEPPAASGNDNVFNIDDFRRKRRSAG